MELDKASILAKILTKKSSSVVCCVPDYFSIERLSL
jgi:hypothetical protein